MFAHRSPLQALWAIIGSTLKYIILVTYLVAVVFPMCWVLYTSVKSTQEIYKNPFGLPKLMTSPDPDSWFTLVQNYENAWVKSHFSS